MGFKRSVAVFDARILYPFHLRNIVVQAAADRIGRRLVEACDSLDKLPNRGKLGLVAGAREITTVLPYVIVYQVLPDEVQVIRVWHGARGEPEAHQSL